MHHSACFAFPSYHRQRTLRILRKEELVSWKNISILSIKAVVTLLTWRKYLCVHAFLSNVSGHNGLKTETQKLSSEQQQTFFYWESDWALTKVAQEGCVVSVLGDIQMTPGLGSGQAALGSPAWAGMLHQMTFRGLFQTQPFCDSVYIICLCLLFFHSYQKLLFALFP